MHRIAYLQTDRNSSVVRSCQRPMSSRAAAWTASKIQTKPNTEHRTPPPKAIAGPCLSQRVRDPDRPFSKYATIYSGQARATRPSPAKMHRGASPRRGPSEGAMTVRTTKHATTVPREPPRTSGIVPPGVCRFQPSILLVSLTNGISKTPSLPRFPLLGIDVSDVRGLKFIANSSLTLRSPRLAWIRDIRFSAFLAGAGGRLIAPMV
jgi:hypothetical protein